jgi:hypothetical protein
MTVLGYVVLIARAAPSANSAQSRCTLTARLAGVGQAQLGA